MKSIIEEIIDWQTAELIAGRKPTEIPLTKDQIERLREWACTIPSFEMLPAQKGIEILGMKVVPYEILLLTDILDSATQCPRSAYFGSKRLVEA